MVNFKNWNIGVYDIKFYLMDEDGNVKTDSKGNEIIYRLKDDVRLKSLEYITDDMDVLMLEPEKKEIKWKKMKWLLFGVQRQLGG